MKKSVVLFFMAAISLSASAQKPEKIGDFWYTFSTYDPTSATLVADPNGGTYSGDLVIPDVVEHNGQECRVAYIGKRAFSGTNILSVTIKGKFDDKGRGLSIERSAFSECNSLTSVKIEEGVTSIGYCAFYKCANLTNVVVGDDVSYISDQAFQNSPSLTTVFLGKAMSGKSIGASAFFGCKKLKDFYCYGEFCPKQGWGLIFEDSQFENMTLHVPEAYYTNYIFDDGRDNYPWQHFGSAKKMQNTKMWQCEKPKISYANGNVSFTCDTSGATFNSTVEYVENSFNNASEFPAPSHFRVRVVAVKDGYLPSEMAEQEFALAGIVDAKTGDYKEGDVNRDGNVNDADRLKLTNIIMNK